MYFFFLIKIEYHELKHVRQNSSDRVSFVQNLLLPDKIKKRKWFV